MSSVIHHDSIQCNSFVVKDTDPQIFTSGHASIEMPELLNSGESLDAHPNFHSKLDHLLMLQKQGTNTQLQLQQLLLCSIYPIRIQRILNFELPMECLPNPKNLLDIGFIVRRLLLKWHSSNVLYRLYQYSMPFIKHNRLNFPSLRLLDVTVLKHMILSIFLTCLGSHRLDSKTPVLSLSLWCRQLDVCSWNIQANRHDAHRRAMSTVQGLRWTELAQCMHSRP